MNFKFSLPTLLFVLSLLPLLAYPAVLVANIMQVAALSDRSLRSKGEPPFSWKRVLMGALLVGTTAYPLVVLGCRIAARVSSHTNSNLNSDRELAWSAAPLGFLAVLAVVVWLLLRAEAASGE